MYEFINKFIIPTTEVDIMMNNKPDVFTIRSKSIYAHMHKAPSQTFNQRISHLSTNSSNNAGINNG